MSVKILVTILALLLAGPALAQGYGGLSEAAEEYGQVVPGRVLTFPEDHQPHPDYRIEWWYITANMEDAEGAPLGLQWTLFRQATRPGEDIEGWASRQIWMGHAAVTTATMHRVSETFARGGIGQAGVEAGPFRAFIDDWEMVGKGSGVDLLRLRASGTDFAYDVALMAEGPLVLQGDAGYSVKSEIGQASYYYSQPHYTLEGTVVLDGEQRQVRGTAWLDREWSSQPLASDQTGWDWFSLHFGDGTKLMAYRLRGGGTYTTGTWIEADGSASLLPNGEMAFTVVAETEVEGRTIPTRWRLEWPERELDITVGALNPLAFMTTVFPYWEGPVTVEGSHTGLGYLEMTGYGAE
ncbi:lipocalin-like domain-containing protein [Algicella marina]|uniref:Iron ABC transporter permease n=1 Tax=Algicella marina TaxID=2683284 RepID=A0A6P1T5F3_9RHOB|nr:lipocalin-like domain-containing protein [Algicella marina]QHQ35782.1 iron ABC transporter permease [Algicella marina]